MRKKTKVLTTLISASMLMISTVIPTNAAAGITYMEPVASGVSLDPYATAGDSVGGYLIGGIPDGMGVIPANGKLRVLTNHEWSSSNPLAITRVSASGMTSASYVSEML